MSSGPDLESGGGASGSSVWRFSLAIWKKALSFLGAGTAIVAVAGAGFAWSQVKSFDESVAQVYDVPARELSVMTAQGDLTRGAHLARSVAGCALTDCHGADLSGGRVTEAGPLGVFSAPNLTHNLAGYSDAELARLIRHGIKKDGRTVLMMPVKDFNWLPDEELASLIAWLRTAAPKEKTTAPTIIRPLGKILDRVGKLELDMARHIDHDSLEIGPPPSESREYGAYLARLCTGCHGAHLSGGALPGAPPDLPVPLNLTPHATGLAGWSLSDFNEMIESGRRKDGKALASFMPIEALRAMNETERQALFSYLSSLPPRPFGER